jgi:hypothetical protein
MACVQICWWLTGMVALAASFAGGADRGGMFE